MPGVAGIAADKRFDHVPFPQAKAFLLRIRRREDGDFIKRTAVPDIKIVVRPEAVRGGRNWRDGTTLFQSAFEGYGLRSLPKGVGELAVQFEIPTDSFRL